MNELPADMYGRIKEGVHVAGYTFERACNHLERLLNDDAWKLGGRFEDVNVFLDSIKLDQFRIVTDQRKRIAQRIKELQPEASQSAIARVVGVAETTIRRDLDIRPSTNVEIDENALTANGANSTNVELLDFGGAEVARLITQKQESEQKKIDRSQEIEEQRQAINSGAVTLPEGAFEVLVLDPPWNYGRDYDPAGSRVANPYPEMTQAELLAMELPAADDCVLFLWTTHQFIWDAKELLTHWGFDYKATLVWDKEKVGMGAWLRMQCEFCLVGIKGKTLWSNTAWRDIIREPRREHSRKPESFYRMVEDVTAGRRLDYFSRERRDGWGSYGNDVDRFK